MWSGGTGEGFGQQQAPDGEAPALQPPAAVETEARMDSMLNNNIPYLSIKKLTMYSKIAPTNSFLVVGTGAWSGQRQVHDGGMPALQQASTVETEARVDSMLNNNILYLSRNLKKPIQR